MDNSNFKPFFLDSLSLKKLALPLPTNPDTPISIYACGITPYSDAHIGHARSYIIFDLLANVFKQAGYKVNLVRNITDIDDKIINAAAAKQIPWHELSDQYAAKTRQLMIESGLEVPAEPKASEYLEDIFSLIQKLLDKGHAYIANNDVLYKVDSYKGPLLMNHKEGSLKSEQGITRTDASHKIDNRDFALWKSMPVNEVGFDSPWGWGRPGWHIECTAMIGNIFGGHVDIHGGGVDLKFPHHQAEIMQSEPVWEKPVAKIWMHNGSVLSNGVKMSKSLNNFITWQDALGMADKKQSGLAGDILKLALLGAHWQKPLDWKDSLLDTASELLTLVSTGLNTEVDNTALQSAKEQLLSMLSQNLNTPQVFTFIKSKKSSKEFPALAQAFVQTFALKVNKSLVKEIELETLSPEILNLIEQRNQARLNQDWDLADKLRIELKDLGYIQKDKPKLKI
jgi:cysteinyl-tRNA synthetase